MKKTLIDLNQRFLNKAIVEMHMSELFRIFVVDDDPLMLDIMRAILEPDSAVETFASVEDCLPRLTEEKPDMFLLDVGLPGMDGYAFCRQLKDDAVFRRIPVTFVSAHDDIDARVCGYDAGGEDFVVKPFGTEELRRKVRVTKQLVLDRQSLEEQLGSAEYLSSLALAGMDEGGIALQFMSRLIAWENEREVADGLLDLMQRYRLNGVVQTRVARRKLTVSAAGVNLPIEMSVLDHVSGLGRIFEFKSRGVHNFERVSLMVNNLPLHDPDYCGRLRDNLSIAAQGADSRLRAIEIEETNRRNHAIAMTVTESVRAALADLKLTYQQDKFRSSELIMEMEKGLADSFVHLGLTDGQELYLTNLVNDYMQRLVTQFDRSEETYSALQNLGEQLGQLQ